MEKENNFQREYDRLNARQKEAVDLIDGPVMVVAGPGTGKTQILAMRIANILKKTQANPSNILCLTFTNSGVHAMKERLLSIIGQAGYQIHVHTFHSFCNEVINTFPEKFLTSKQLDQITDLEQVILIQDIIKNNSFEYIKPFKSPFHFQGEIISAIGKLKQEFVTPKKFREIIETERKEFQEIDDLYHEKGSYKGQMKAKYKTQLESINRNQELSKVYELYQSTLLEQGKYDYSDMILNVLNAFNVDPDILSFYQEKFQYILVDEYQDTNGTQNEIIRLLSSFYSEPNLFVVGDDEQSIFRFQGASLENILIFNQLYPDAKIIVLDNNYRSTQKILDASRKLIENNKNQIFNRLNLTKSLKSNIPILGEIQIGSFSTGAVEDFFITNRIKELISDGMPPSEIAILYKEHNDAKDLVEMLSKSNIPYHLEIGGDILEDPEIKKLVNFLKILDYKQADDSVLFEVLHYPYFKISPLEIYKLARASYKSKLNIIDALISDKQVIDESSENLRKFCQNIILCSQFCQQNTFARSFEYIITQTGYLDYLLSIPDSVHHLNRLQLFYQEIKGINAREKDLTVSKFLSYLDQMKENGLKMKDKEIEADYQGIKLMTAHKSKGLEFKVVFIKKFIDKHWGNKKKRELIKLPKRILTIEKNDGENLDEANEEEERRLFYVALTRAKEKIYLTYAENYGDEENEILAIPSKFLGEIPQESVSKIDTKEYENKHEERLALSFSPSVWKPLKEVKEYIKSLVNNFTLSATSFNAYLECPLSFMYDHVIRVPKAKDFNQAYGTAIHKALEIFFMRQIRDSNLPEKSELTHFFEESLNSEILTGEELERALATGKKTLSDYYDFYIDDFKKKGRPVSCEYNFASHNVHYKDIPITGKIDKIELISSVSNNVRIIDYKTSKPKSLNELTGLTKNSDLSYLYQAYFYKLLSEADPQFRWNISEIVFDFIQPDKGKFKRVEIPINEQKYQEFKTLIQSVYSEIISLDFLPNKKSCKERGKECPYIPICEAE